MPPTKLAQVPAGFVNLLCATLLPDTGDLDLPACLRTIGEWVAFVRSETTRQLHKFRGSPGEYENSEASRSPWAVLRLCARCASEVSGSPPPAILYGICYIYGRLKATENCPGNARPIAMRLARTQELESWCPVFRVAEMEAMRLSIARGRPYGSDKWTAETAKKLGLEYTLRDRGRPKKEREDAGKE